jgi:hypothetical protein
MEGMLPCGKVSVVTRDSTTEATKRRPAPSLILTPVFAEDGAHRFVRVVRPAFEEVYV